MQMNHSLSGDLESADQQACMESNHVSLPTATRASTRVRFPTIKIMESARQAPKKRKASQVEEPVIKKPRTTVKPSTANKVSNKAQAASAAQKAAKEIKQTKSAPAKSASVKGKARALHDDSDTTSDAYSEKERERTRPSSKQPKVPKQPKAAKQPGISKPPTRVTLPTINEAPSEILDVYVFGEGSASELGLGNAKNAINVKRPRLNPYLSAKEVGVVLLACGGMHSAALTRDNRILTWGVNDLGALGRDTSWNGGWKNADAGSEMDVDVDEDEIALNPHECKPGVVSSEHFPEGTKFSSIVCGDSSTFVLTTTGLVYGWGTFRGNEGAFGFSAANPGGLQTTPVLIEGVKNITQIACGANHVLALNQRGEVWTWGSGEQNQLGHRIVERRKFESLTPKLLRIASRKVRLIGCGHYHSFAVDSLKRVWVWGLNSFGQAGVQNEAGGDGAVVFSIKRVENLKLPNNENIESITGGAHHSIAVTSLGRCFTWGRMDGNQMGLSVSTIPPEDMIYDDREKPRILIKPTAVPGVGKVIHAATGTDNTITINSDGKAYSWGFNVNYQCGQGIIDDITVPTLIDNTAVRGKKLNWAGAGGQFSIVAGPSEFQNPLAAHASAS